MPTRDVNPLSQLADNRFAAPTLGSKARLLDLDFDIIEAPPTEPLQALRLILHRVRRRRDVCCSFRKGTRAQGVRVISAHIYRAIWARVEFRRDRFARRQSELGEESMRGDGDRGSKNDRG